MQLFHSLDPSVKSNSEQQYLFLSVQNKLSKAINLFWEWNDIGYITSIPANQRQYLQIYINGANDAFVNFNFNAKYEDRSKEEIMLNGQRRIRVKTSSEPTYKMITADSSKSWRFS